VNRAYHPIALVLLTVLAGCGDVSEQSPGSQSNTPVQDAVVKAAAGAVFAAQSAGAEQGDAEAQLWRGSMYDMGVGVPRDDVEAVKWYRLAADQGLAEAQGMLGTMYSIGEGVPQDYAEAYVWYSVAYAGGHANAAQSRDRIAKQLTPEQLSQAQKRATELFEKIQSSKK